MEKLIDNPNLAIDIGQKITNFLDNESLQTCRLVNKSMKNLVNDPTFWLRRLNKRGLFANHVLSWKRLIVLVENTDFVTNVTNCLMRMCLNFDLESQVNFKNEWCQAPIFVAAKAGDAILAQFILMEDNLINVDSVGPNENGCTPMDLAAARGHVEVVKLFISNSNNPNAPDANGWTPMHRAARRGHVDIMKILMSTNSIPIPNMPDKDGYTPLHTAARHGKSKVVKLLMSVSDTNFNFQDHLGWTPINLAAHNGHIRIVKLLVTALTGNDRKSTENLNLANGTGYTPIHNAVINLKTHVRRTREGRKYHRCKFDDSIHYRIIKILLSSGSYNNPNAPNNVGVTPIHQAAYYGHLEVIQLLMSKMNQEFDNPNPPRHDGCTPLHFAADQGHIEIVKLLMSSMSFDGNPNAPNNAGFTPRDAALQNNHQDIAALFLNE